MFKKKNYKADVDSGICLKKIYKADVDDSGIYLKKYL